MMVWKAEQQADRTSEPVAGKAGRWQSIHWDTPPADRTCSRAGRFPGSRVLAAFQPSQRVSASGHHQKAQLSVYSCGGSSGFDTLPRLTVFPLSPGGVTPLGTNHAWSICSRAVAKASNGTPPGLTPAPTARRARPASQSQPRQPQSERVCVDISVDNRPLATLVHRRCVCRVPGSPD